MKESDEYINESLTNIIKYSPMISSLLEILEKHKITTNNYLLLSKELKVKLLSELMYDYIGEYTDQIKRDYDTSYNISPQSHIMVSNNEMLYINISMRNNTYQAFIDTGAGLSFISKKVMIERGLENRLNKKYRTKAISVGSSITLGKIFNLDFTIGPATLTWNFTVMEQGPDFLIGLDILKYCSDYIDFKTNTISFNNIHMPLLKSHEVNDESILMQHMELTAKETGKSISTLLVQKEKEVIESEDDINKAIRASLETSSFEENYKEQHINEDSDLIKAIAASLKYPKNF